MGEGKNLMELLKSHAGGFHPIVPFDAAKDKLLPMDFTAANTALTDEVLQDTNLFTQYINHTLSAAGAKYGIGGYAEHRTIYRRSTLFGPQGPHPGPPPMGEGAANTQPSLKQDSDDVLKYDVGEFYQEADVLMYRLLKAFVAQHRKHATLAEELLWQHLRGNKLDGYSFRRQHIIGHYIADFVCLSKKLIVEVDGLQHQLPDNIASDTERTLWLNMKGYKVIRFTNNEVLFDTNNVLNGIRKKLEELPFTERKIYTKSTTSSQSKPSEQIFLPLLGQGPGMGAGPRTLHLGTDIWGAPHTKVTAPLDGMVHSFGFHPALGNYGAVILLSHRLDGVSFYTLYGHLSLGSIKNLQEGDRIKGGDVFAEFGIPQENGQWPPHLHFQVMRDVQGWKGDYPGVCAVAEKELWLYNCINPDLILSLNRYL